MAQRERTKYESVDALLGKAECSEQPGGACTADQDVGTISKLHFGYCITSVLVVMNNFERKCSLR